MKSKLAFLLMFFVAFPGMVFASPDLKLPFTVGEIWNVTTGYGGSITHQSHDYYALDFNVSNDCGRSILSSAYGRAEIHEGWNGGYGNYVDIIHGDGYVTRYAHLESISIYENQWVFQGQEIGKCGTSGNSSGCHLHFALYNQGNASISEPLDGYTSIIEGGWYQSDNGEYSQIANWDNLCKYSDANPLVERFRGTSGKIEVNMTPSDNKVYYYSDGFCNIDYHSFYTNTGEGGGCLPGGESDCDESHNSLGPGYETIPTESPDDGLPDFVLDELIITDTSGNERYEFDQSDRIELHAYAKNIGDADWAAFDGEPEADDIYVKFYLSDGYKEDPHSEWDCVGTQQIQKGNLDQGVTKHEEDALNLYAYDNGNPIEPGVYNIVACVDRKYDQNNGDGEVPEIHKSNNCSTEAVFLVQKAPPSANFTANKTIGMTPLTVNFTDTSGYDPTSWSWTFGDGSTSTIRNPSHTYTTQGNFTVTLTATNEAGESITTKTNYIQIAPPPTIVVTNPESTDNWRSDGTKHIRWNRNNFPVQGNVKIQYSLNNGSTWRTIDSQTNNDGSRYWSMCGYYTVDTPNGRIRITSIQYPNVSGMSQRFYIDHARGCE